MCVIVNIYTVMFGNKKGLPYLQNCITSGIIFKFNLIFMRYRITIKKYVLS